MTAERLENLQGYKPDTIPQISVVSPAEEKGLIVMKKVRAGNHSGRKGSHGTYNVKHNDRQFNIEHAPHIDQSRIEQNVYWKFHEDKIPQEDRNPNATFEEHEQQLYYALFSKELEVSNNKYIQQRHKEKVRSMEQFRKNEKHCPEEDLIYLGDKKNHVSPELMKAVFEEYRKWHEETFEKCILLDAALHLDETTPHIHMRKVWTADYSECAEYSQKHDKRKLPLLEEGEEDYLIVNQNASLRQMGIEPPDSEKKIGKYNNPKMTYSAMCRKQLIAIAEKHGVEIIEEPKERDEVGLVLTAYKVREAKAELNQLVQAYDNLQNTINTILHEAEKNAKQNGKEILSAAETKLHELERSYDNLQETINVILRGAEDSGKEILAEAEQKKKAIESEVGVLSDKAEQITGQIHQLSEQQEQLTRLLTEGRTELTRLQSAVKLSGMTLDRQQRQEQEAKQRTAELQRQQQQQQQQIQEQARQAQEQERQQQQRLDELNREADELEQYNEELEQYNSSLKQVSDEKLARLERQKFLIESVKKNCPKFQNADVLGMGICREIEPLQQKTNEGIEIG